MEENEAVTENQETELEQETVAEQEGTATPEPEQQPEQQEQERTFTQQELDEKVEKRLARERRKMEREMAARLPPQDEQERQPEEVINRKAEQLAKEIVSRREWETTAKSIFERGKDFAPDFAQVVGRQDLLLPREVIDAALLNDNGHEVLYHLGKNPEEAEDIAYMPPHLQGAHIVKLAAKLAAKKDQPRQSNAPPPIKPVGAKGVAPKRFGDDLDDSEFDRIRREYKEKRR